MVETIPQWFPIHEAVRQAASSRQAALVRLVVKYVEAASARDLVSLMETFDACATVRFWHLPVPKVLRGLPEIRDHYRSTFAETHGIETLKVDRVAVTDRDLIVEGREQRCPNQHTAQRLIIWSADDAHRLTSKSIYRGGGEISNGVSASASQ